MDALVQAFQLLFGENPELREIIGVTLQMSFFSTSISALLGIPSGVWIGSNEFRGKAVVQAYNTLMGCPGFAGLMSRSFPAAVRWVNSSCCTQLLPW
jgi:tungstate transport system permease protein